MKIFKLFLIMHLLSLISSSIILKEKKNKIIPESNKLQIDINRDENSANILSENKIILAKLNRNSIPNQNEEDEISLLSHPKHNIDNFNKKPLLEINDPKEGLNEMGQIGSRLFKMNPMDLYKDEKVENIDDMNFDLDEALKESHMKIPVMLSPSVLKSMIFYLENHDQYNDKWDEKKKKKNNEIREKEQYMTEDELAEQETQNQIEANEHDVKNLEHDLKNLKKKINQYKVTDEEDELDSDEKEIEKEIKNKEDKEEILEKKDEVEKEIINLQDVENELVGKDTKELEAQKEKLEAELKELIEDANNKDKIAAIEKEIEEIEKTLAEMNKEKQKQLEEHLEAEKDKLVEEENELEDKENLDFIKVFEGKFTIKELPDVLRILEDLEKLLNNIYKDIPIDLKNYETAEDDLEKEKEGMLIYTKLQEFKREFLFEKKNIRKTIQFLKNKTYEIQLSTEGMMEFLIQSGIYADMRLGAPEKNFDYYEIDKKIRLETDKMSDEMRIFMDKLSAVIKLTDDIDSKIEFFKIEEEQIEKNHSEQNEIDIKKLNEEKIDLCLQKLDGFVEDKDIIFRNLNELKNLVTNFKNRKNNVFDFIDELQAKIEEHQIALEKEALEENAIVLKFLYFFGLILLY